MNSKILIVDDDTSLLDGLQRLLRKQFQITTALGGAEALDVMAKHGPFAVVVADMQMPEMSGLQFLMFAQVQSPDTVRIMLTGNADQATAADAVNDGSVFRFLTKPCHASTLVPALEAALEHYRLRQAERDLLQNTLGGALKVLTEILSQNDPATFKRGQYLRDRCREFGAVTGFPVTWETEIAATLLTIGRVTIPPGPLESMRLGLPLSREESELQQHIPEFGARLLENIPRLENIVAIIRYQNKSFDGSGFPLSSMAGADIPFGARLLKFLSDLIELEEEGLTRAEAWQKMQERIGRYDPEILNAAIGYCEVVQTPKLNPPEELLVDQLAPGQTLAQDLCAVSGLFLLPAGTKLTPMLIAKLVNFRRLQTIHKTILVHPR
jgi:response regulator RpfG family c-di-GMP phosphodiesterase